MTRAHILTFGAALLTLSQALHAQAPPRPNDTPRAVTLTLAEYNRLLDLANRPPQGALVAPLEGVVGSADLRVRVDGDTVRGEFAITGDAFRAGINRVNLLPATALIDANAQGRPLPLVVDGNARAAFIPGPGAFSLSLEWGTSLTYPPGRAGFVLPVPLAGTARARFDIPGDQADVHLLPGLITSKTVADGRTIIDATLNPGTQTLVSWSMRDSAPAAAVRELRTLSDVMTLVTIGDSDVRMIALIDVTVVQGEMRTVALRLPAGYEVTGVSGSSLEHSEPTDEGLVLTVGNQAARSHQFLVSLERPHEGGSFSLGTGFVSVRDVQRERGEVAIEGVGTLELTAEEREPMHRIDVRELNQPLQSLARLPILSAFRYQRTPAAPALALALDVERFADAGVLAAVADRAMATTLVTSEGRALTEIVLTVQNRAQPFLKVTLPAGATMVSVDVAGQPAKPVSGADGIRVPLLRPGFRPTGAYQVSFVYLHAGIPFAKKGDLEMTLPRMDMPVGIVQWELFAPETYSVKTTGGNAIDVETLGADLAHVAGVAPVSYQTGPAEPIRITLLDGEPVGTLKGRAADVTGAALPGVIIELTTARGRVQTVTNSTGEFVATNVAPGQVGVTATLAGFSTARATFDFDGQARRLEFTLAVGALAESVTVTAEAPRVSVESSAAGVIFRSDAPGNAPAPPPQKVIVVPPSQGVIDLQRKASGVLPVRVDVPRAGTVHRFVKPLVVDQETVVRLRYKRRG